MPAVFVVALESNDEGQAILRSVGWSRGKLQPRYSSARCSVTAARLIKMRTLLLAASTGTT